MKQFNTTAILTSQNPEAFLNFTYDSSEYWIIPDCCVAESILYVNGLDINKYMSDPSEKFALSLDATNNVASFHIYTDINYEFDTNLQFKFYHVTNVSSGSIDVSTQDISILNRPYIIDSGIISTYDNEDFLVDDEASYMILRTNPKFTGNIVLNVDCSNNLYLDTFKISDILSNKKYRRQKVSGNSVLSGDIRNVFSTMPLGELYKVDADDTLDIAVPKTELKKHFYTTYNYGARLLKDELYAEDNGILAPLWINSKLPDYFAIFRLDGNYNEETYDGSTLNNLAFKYLEDSDLIKNWSIKPSTTLGKYLNTHKNDIDNISAPVFLSLTDPSSNESDPNTWYGIAVDKGVVTGRSETTYYFDLNSNNYTNLNGFISKGFERNTLLCPNLINLQFIFSDDDVSLYTMSRYFGLYLTENVLYNIAYYSDTSNGSVSIISLDGKDSNTFFDSSIFNVDGSISDDYKNRIFVLNDGEQLHRITNVNQINDSSWNSYVSKPKKNIFSTKIERTDINPFITLTLNNKLNQGEHLRLINKSQYKIWEVYGIDGSTYSCTRYCTTTESENGTHATLYRTYFDVTGDISDQIKSIKDAFETFSEYETVPLFRTGIYGNDWVSLVLNDDASFAEKWQFQRITGSTLDDFSDPSSNFNDAANPNDITFHGRFTPNSSDFETITYDSSYGPIDFELYGNRKSISLDLFNRETNYLYTFESSANILDKFEDPLVYQDVSLWYRKTIDFDVSNNSYQYIKDPVSIDDNVLIMTNKDIKTISNVLNAYNITPLTISIMGINPVKDIDFTVYDSSELGYESEYAYKREDDVSSYKIFIESGNNKTILIPNSYTIELGTGTITQKDASTRAYNTASGTNILINTFDNSANVFAGSDTVISYAQLDGSYNYSALKSGKEGSEEQIDDYYDSSSLLKYGLTVPFVSKWVGLGNDCRNNPLRLILNNDALNVNSNFIPNDSNFTQELSYPVFKYLTPGTKAWESYIFYDINDVIYDPSTASYVTLKDAMFAYPYIDYFSKIVYSNYNVDNKNTRSSIVYYNQYKNTIDVILLGLNLSFKVQNIAKNVINIKNYDRYRFSFISTPSRNKDNNRPIEVIINENTQTILMIWYQGNDILNYNKRYSSYLSGKSLLDPDNNGFVTSSKIDASHYSFTKTPFYTNNSTIQKSLLNFYGASYSYDNDTLNRYAQFNKNTGGFSSIWNAPGTGNSMTVSFVFTPETDVSTYNTFSQYVDYTYTQNSNTYGDYVMNYGYNYSRNENWYTSNTTNIATLKFLLSSSRRDVMYYIIREDEKYDSFDFGTANPILISINSPRTYRNVITYNGWFKPKFNTILNFKPNDEKDLINTVNKDLIFSNTNLRTYSNIPQMWYNKVVTSVSASDVSEGNAISYIEDFNIFKSQWDASYYIKDSSYINGYQSSYELPSFFGSKLPKFPNELILEKWDVTTTTYTSDDDTISMSFNLTRAIINKFKSSIEFLNNWAGLTNSDDIIDSYIEDTILSYYNLSQSKIKVDFYVKSYSSRVLWYEYDSNFTLDEKENFEGQIKYENDEYIYDVDVPKTGNYSYFVKITLTEK